MIQSLHQHRHHGALQRINMRRLTRLVLCNIVLSLALCVAPACDAFTTLITFDVDGTLVRGTGMEADASRPMHVPLAMHEEKYWAAAQRSLGQLHKRYHVICFTARPMDSFSVAWPRQSSTSIKFPKSELQEMMQCMYEYTAGLDDEQVAKGIEILPGVLDHLTTLGQLQKDQPDDFQSRLRFGHGKMWRALRDAKCEPWGVLDPLALSPPAPEGKLLLNNHNDKNGGRV
jgi:hypothetical protein